MDGFPIRISSTFPQIHDHCSMIGLWLSHWNQYDNHHIIIITFYYELKPSSSHITSESSHRLPSGNLTYRNSQFTYIFLVSFPIRNIVFFHRSLWTFTRGYDIWLVVWNMFYFFIFFPYIGNLIIPIDVHIFQRGRAQPPTRSLYHRYSIDIIMIIHRLSIDYP